MANKPDEFPVFTKLDKSMVLNLVAKLNLYLADFVSSTGIVGITTDESTFIEIVDRIEKRRVYFHIFYNKCRMSELNEGALTCFWIIKLCPFHCPSVPSGILNAKIALFLFTKVIYLVAKAKGRQAFITEQITKDIFYSFRFRDISKESLMLLAEGMIR